MKELSDSHVRLANLKSRIEVNDRKFAFLSGARSQFLGAKAAAPEISISRDVGDGVQKFKATEDSTLMPGDVVEVLYPKDVDLGLTR
jgi:hypothetical protein